ncbi:hypothetical protein ACVOMV_06905 [Mesorhizobium atlanticum]
MAAWLKALVDHVNVAALGIEAKKPGYLISFPAGSARQRQPS